MLQVSFSLDMEMKFPQTQAKAAYIKTYVIFYSYLHLYEHGLNLVARRAFL